MMPFTPVFNLHGNYRPFPNRTKHLANCCISIRVIAVTNRKTVLTGQLNRHGHRFAGCGVIDLSLSFWDDLETPVTMHRAIVDGHERAIAILATAGHHAGTSG